MTCLRANCARNPACLITRQIKHASQRDIKRVVVPLPPPKLLNRPPRCSALVDDEYKQPQEIGLSKHVSIANRTMSRVVAQNAGEAALSCHQDLICSQTKAPCFHTDLSFARPIQRTSYLILVDSYSKWPEVIPIKSAKNGAITNGQQYRKNLGSQCVTLTFKSKTNPTEIYLDTCGLPLPLNLETPET
ncbi:hypothetical protein ACTXT7_007534 [Hymenolepis weldensis]